MKKIFEILKLPFVTTLICVSALTCSLLLGFTIDKLFFLQETELNKRDACHDAYSIMCVQANRCIGSSVSECDELVSENELCNVKLPDVQVILRCYQELRHISCEDNLPASCSIFME